MATRDQFAAVFLGWNLLRFVCGSCDVRIAVKSGQEVELTSPNYPQNFSNQLHCFYDLTTEFTAGEVLRLSILDVTLSCGDPDTTLEVFDAFSTSAMYLGKVCAGSVSTFVSPRERLYLVFKSRPGANNGTTSRGFKLSVKSLSEFTHCYTEQALVVPVLLEPQHFISPYYPLQVAPNVHCRWLLKAPQGHRIHLDILHADMKGSDDCVNFGLYIYDGKTSYDDEKLATVCSNSSRSFCSTRNYLMVVFTSSAHVLHSGSGIKLGYYSSITGNNAEKTDSSLLFILVGVLLGLATFTIVMVILRFIVIPARMQALARRYHPNTANSITGSRTVAAISVPNDPPPPYEATDLGNHQQKKHTSWRSMCGCCFLRDKTDMRRSSQNAGLNNDVAHVLRDLPRTPGHLATSQIISELTENSIHTLPSYLQSGISPSNTPQPLQTLRNINTPALSNEYQELPDPVCRERALGSEITDNVVNSLVGSRNPGGHAARYSRVDSGFQESASEETGSSNSMAYINNAHTGTPNLEDTDDQLHIHNISRPGCDRHGNGNISGHGDCNDETPYEIDDCGYEVPVSSHHYDRLSNVGEDIEDEGEGVYHKLDFDVK